MTLQFSVACRTNQAAQYQATVGTAGTLTIYSGAEPTNCAAANPSGPLVVVSLPTTFLTAASGATALAGTWQANASATGTAASFRIADSSGTCHIQGTCGTSGADMILSNTSINSGQSFSVSAFSITQGNQ